MKLNLVHLNQWWLTHAKGQKVELTKMDPRFLGCQNQLDWFWCVHGRRKDLWYLDSGCSRNITGDQSLLTWFKEKAGPCVTFGDDKKRLHIRIWHDGER